MNQSKKKHVRVIGSFEHMVGISLEKDMRDRMRQGIACESLIKRRTNNVENTKE